MAKKQEKEVVRKEVSQVSKKPHHGKNLKYFRRLKGYSQEYLASELKQEATQQTISEWEKQEILPIEILKELAKILDIGISWLTDSKIDENSDSIAMDGEYTMFHRNDYIAYTVHNPLEAMERNNKHALKEVKSAYVDAGIKVDKAYEDSKASFAENAKKTETILTRELDMARERITVLENTLTDIYKFSLQNKS